MTAHAPLLIAANDILLLDDECEPIEPTDAEVTDLELALSDLILLGLVDELG